jgi:hypothetical protein
VTSAAGIFADDVLVLRLGVDFSNGGIFLSGLSGLKVAPGNPMAGSTVTQVLLIANQVLAGNTSALPTGMSVASLNTLVSNINLSYASGTITNGFLVP